jgi:4-hydroxy-4-methyl-2-oxoglutarate aldolase
MTDPLLEAFRSYTCFDAGYIEGLTFPMDPAIRPLAPGMHMLGRAFTVDEVNAICKNVFNEIGPDEVLGVRGNDPQRKGGCGLMVCELAAKRGASGVVIDGGAQDTPKLRALGFPLFCRYVTPTHGSLRLVGRTQLGITCGGVAVNPGDIILGDDDGVLVIPQQNAEEVLCQVRLMRQARDYVDACVRRGMDLWEIPGLKEMWAEKEKGIDYHWKVYAAWNHEYIPPEFQ